jgi:hypothetical protein
MTKEYIYFHNFKNWMSKIEYIILKLENTQWKVISINHNGYCQFYKGLKYTKEAINFLKTMAQYKYIDVDNLIKKHYDKLINF